MYADRHQYQCTVHRSTGPFNHRVPGMNPLMRSPAKAGPGSPHLRLYVSHICSVRSRYVFSARSFAPRSGAHACSIYPLNWGPRSLGSVSMARICRFISLISAINLSISIRSSWTLSGSGRSCRGRGCVDVRESRSCPRRRAA